MPTEFNGIILLTPFSFAASLRERVATFVDTCPRLVPKEGPVPRSYPTLLVAILAAGGWYFSKNPGKLHEFIAAISQRQGTSGQAAPGGYFPTSNPYPANSYPTNSYPTYPSQQPPVPVQTNYNGQPAAPAAPPTPASGGPAIRIATFNIQVFGEKKASNPYVMATLPIHHSEFPSRRDSRNPHAKRLLHRRVPADLRERERPANMTKSSVPALAAPTAKNNTPSSTTRPPSRSTHVASSP